MQVKWPAVFLSGAALETKPEPTFAESRSLNFILSKLSNPCTFPFLWGWGKHIYVWMNVQMSQILFGPESNELRHKAVNLYL